MANHPLNLGLRFFLEIIALICMGYWGWKTHTGVERWLWTIGLPVLAAAFWGVFRVPGDPGNAPIATAGMIRLLLEFVFFGIAVWALYAAGLRNGAYLLAAVVLIHYAISTDRIIWLLKQ